MDWRGTAKGQKTGEAWVQWCRLEQTGPNLG